MAACDGVAVVSRHNEEGILHHPCFHHLVIDLAYKSVNVGDLRQILCAGVAVTVAGPIDRVELDEHQLRLMGRKVIDDLAGLCVVITCIHVYVQSGFDFRVVDHIPVIERCEFAFGIVFPYDPEDAWIRTVRGVRTAG